MNDPAITKRWPPPIKRWRYIFNWRVRFALIWYAVAVAVGAQFRVDIAYVVNPVGIT